MGEGPRTMEPAIGPIKPRTNGKSYDLVRPGIGGTVHGIIVNPQLLAVECHYDHLARTNVIHMREGCPYCRKLGQPRWYGYLPGVLLNQSGIVIFEITAYAGVRCKQLVDELPDLRGRSIKLTRFGKGPKGKVRCEIGEAPVKNLLPQAIDGYAAICAIWRFQPEISGIYAALRTKGVQA